MLEKILYFEDDSNLANLVSEILREANFEVVHFSALPSGGIDELVSEVKVQPFLVLMDVRLENQSGFDVCKLLKQDSFFSQVPVIFVSGLIEEHEILQAYDVGAYDYVTKPINFRTLKAKIDAIRRFNEQTRQLQEQVSNTEMVAFDAMTTSSELGEIIRFHDKISKMSDLKKVAKSLVQQIGCFGVSSSVCFKCAKGEVVYCSDDGKEYEIEKALFEILKSQGRIYSWNNRAIFNYDRFSVLVRAMPVDDDKREGILRDQICLLLNGVESRVHGIDNEIELKENQDNIRLIAQTIGKMVVDLQASTMGLSERFEKIVHDLEDDVTDDFARLNLLQDEEKVVMEHIHGATDQALSLFEQARAKDAGYTKVLIELLEQLP